VPNISQRSAVTRLRCDEICNNDFVAHLLHIRTSHRERISESMISIRRSYTGKTHTGQ